MNRVRVELPAELLPLRRLPAFARVDHPIIHIVGKKATGEACATANVDHPSMELRQRCGIRSKLRQQIALSLFNVLTKKVVVPAFHLSQPVQPSIVH